MPRSRSFKHVSGKISERQRKLLAVYLFIHGLFGEKYSEENGIDIFMIHAEGGQINYINSSMDVTKEFTNYLNEQQKALEKDIKK